MCSEQRSGRCHYKHWQGAFKHEFKEVFCMKDEQLTALTKLKGTSWYQGKDLVKDYIDQFSELMDVVEYLDDKAIVIKFCKGLDPNIQNMVATLGECK